MVPGSNPASLTEVNSEDRQSHCEYCKISGQKGKPPPEANRLSSRVELLYGLYESAAVRRLVAVHLLILHGQQQYAGTAIISGFMLY